MFALAAMMVGACSDREVFGGDGGSTLSDARTARDRSGDDGGSTLSDARTARDRSGDVQRKEDAPQCVSETPPSGDGVSRTATFIFQGAKEGWVISVGEHCAPFEIDRGGKRLILDAPYRIECEGPPPPTGAVRRALSLAAEPTIVWNGKRSVAYRACADCSGWGPGPGIVQVMRDTWISAKPGTYTAHFGIYDAIPTHCSCIPKGCQENSPDVDLDCWGGSSSGPWGEGGGVTCPMPKHIVSVPFTLPQAGDVRVPVDLSAP